MKSIRVIPVGCGRRSPAWLRTLQLVEGLELVAICDPIEPRVRDRMSLVMDRSVAGFPEVPVTTCSGCGSGSGRTHLVLVDRSGSPMG